MGSLHRSLEHRRNRQCLLPTLGSAERIGRFGDNSLATAERCKEISQGYALFAYPWKRGQLWNPHPERVSRIPRTAPRCGAYRYYNLCMSGTIGSEYSQWVKTRKPARFNLAASGVAPCAMADLGTTISNIEINGPSLHGFAPLQQAIATHCRVAEDCVVA